MGSVSKRAWRAQFKVIDKREPKTETSLVFGHLHLHPLNILWCMHIQCSARGTQTGWQQQRRDLKTRRRSQSPRAVTHGIKLQRHFHRTLTCSLWVSTRSLQLLTPSLPIANKALSTSIRVKRRRQEASNACIAMLEIRICVRITSSAYFQPFSRFDIVGEKIIPALLNKNAGLIRGIEHTATVKRKWYQFPLMTSPTRTDDAITDCPDESGEEIVVRLSSADFLT